jgi:flavocytochrome c
MISRGITIKWDYEAEVIVAGYGGAGSAAAIEAHDKGASVLIVEKNSKAGGTTAMAGGVIVGAGTSVQKARSIIDSPDEMYRYYRAAGQGLDDPDMTRVYCEDSAANIDWLISLGMEFEGVYMTGAEDYLEYTAITPAKPRGHVTGSMGTFFKVLKNACDKRGINSLYKTQLAEIITNPEGEVIGIKAGSQGKILHIRAKKAVVLTCGGYAYNTEMLRQYSFDKGYKARYTGSASHTGDGIRAGQMLGADLRGMGQIAALPAVQRPGRKVARPLPPPMPGQANSYYSTIFVNKKGKRFTNESGFYNYITRDMLLPGNLPNFLIFDAKVRNTESGSWPPWSYNQDRDIMDETTRKADTIRELAIKIGVDPAGLEETINNYNVNAKKGADPEFGKTRELAPINLPPFYAFECIAGIASTMGGLRINTAAQVINVNGGVIRRLYAAGETTGGILGRYYPASGSALQNAICFGRIAGRNAAAETLRE